jgi:hypothetical protein
VQDDFYDRWLGYVQGGLSLRLEFITIYVYMQYRPVHIWCLVFPCLTMNAAQWEGSRIEAGKRWGRGGDVSNVPAKSAIGILTLYWGMSGMRCKLSTVYTTTTTTTYYIYAASRPLYFRLHG